MEWLKLLDAGDYSACYFAMCKYRRMLPYANDLTSSLKDSSEPFGKLLSRTLRSNSFETSLPHGMYTEPIPEAVIIWFEAKFHDSQKAVEIVTLTKEENGQWKVLECDIKPLAAPPSKPESEAAVSAAAAASQQGTTDILHAAEAWLKLLDAGDFDASYAAADEFFKENVTALKWKSALAYARKPLGKFDSRSLISSMSKKSFPGASDGEYFEMFFKAQFANKKEAVETATFNKGKDGKWRASGYFIK
jgi:hypothetical protein